MKISGSLALVNNAGVGVFRYVEETRPGEAVAMMAVPYFAAFYVTHAFMRAMLKRGSGHIVNVNSPMCRFIWPGATTYTASRFALRGFSEALAADLAGTGIGVTHFVAGKVASPYWENNPGSAERFPKIAAQIPAITPEAAAKALVGGIRRGAGLVVTPLPIRLIFWQHAFFPWFTDWLMRATGYKRPA